jgi:hypothetical protein
MYRKQSKKDIMESLPAAGRRDLKGNAKKKTDNKNCQS